MAWDKVCKLKNEGGLGIKNLDLFNIALFTKWKWRLLTNDDAYWRDIIM